MEPALKGSYSDSHALVIGIDAYSDASPLQYAVNDAEAVANLLIEKLGFESKNVQLLLNDEATADGVLEAYLSFADQRIGSDSRLVVYFAGHGHTLASRRGDVGFLVPWDGEISRVNTLIRWDLIMKSADLIPSKHILYLLDACFGGLAITRSLRPGASRFLVDMLKRYSRQIITAGKADEVVADLGGPLPDHSVFTGHLIEALSGGAADSEGILTANGVMAYVYRHVGQDPASNQTPHFGYLDGDGDLIFDAPILAEREASEKEGEDQLFAVPVPELTGGGHDELSLEDKTKEYLSDPKNRIHLHDLVVESTRSALALTDDEAFPVQGTWSADELSDRLDRYERATGDLMTVSALMGYWSPEEFLDVSTLPARRLAGRIQSASGLNVWLAARWYPALLLMYAFGVSAIAASRFQSLLHYFHVPIPNPRAQKEEALVLSVVAGVGDLQKAFKSLPGHEKHYTPHSEYLFKLLQPKLDDLLFLGPEYERSFDRFEILWALEHAHLNERNGRGFWGPIGRFGWKHHRGHGNPFAELLEEAEVARNDWLPIISGFFDGSISRLEEVSSAFVERINRLGWY